MEKLSWAIFRWFIVSNALILTIDWLSIYKNNLLIRSKHLNGTFVSFLWKSIPISTRLTIACGQFNHQLSWNEETYFRQVIFPHFSLRVYKNEKAIEKNAMRNGYFPPNNCSKVRNSSWNFHIFTNEGKISIGHITEENTLFLVRSRQKVVVVSFRAQFFPSPEWK